MANERLDPAVIKEVVISVVTELDKQGFKKAEKTAEMGGQQAGKGFLSGLKGVAIAAGVTVIANQAAQAFGAVKDAVFEAIEAGDKLQKQARQSGMTAEQLAAIQFAGTQAGVEAEKTTKAFGDLAQRVADARDGSKQMAGIFKQLGVDISDPKAEIEDLFFAVGEGVSALSETERLATLRRLFGESGGAFVNLFSDPKAIKESVGLVKELSGGSLNQFAEQGEKAADAFGQIQFLLKLVGVQLFSKVGPAIVDAFRGAVEILKPAVAGIRDFLDNTSAVKATLSILKASFIAFGIAAGLALAPLLLGLIPIAAAFAGLFLVVEDFFGFLEGEKSLLGRFFEETFGTGSSVAIRKEINQFFEQMPSILETVKTAAMIFGRVFAGIILNIGRIVVGTAQTIRAAMDGVRATFEFVEKVFTATFSAFEAGVMVVTDAIDGLVSGLEKALKVGKELLGGDFSSITSLISGAVGGIAGVPAVAAVRAGSTSTSNTEMRQNNTFNITTTDPDRAGRAVGDAVGSQTKNALSSTRRG